jgi:hypothetical protein
VRVVTVPELLSHLGAVLTGAVPTLGLVVRERAKRQTAEARALAGALGMATEALERAKKAETKAEQCEEHREKDKEGREECERRTAALYAELMRLRHELETSGTLTKSDPERETPPEIIEAWNARFASKHTGVEPEAKKA